MFSHWIVWFSVPFFGWNDVGNRTLLLLFRTAALLRTRPRSRERVNEKLKRMQAATSIMRTQALLARFSGISYVDSILHHFDSMKNQVYTKLGQKDCNFIHWSLLQRISSVAIFLASASASPTLEIYESRKHAIVCNYKRATALLLTMRTPFSTMCRASTFQRCRYSRTWNSTDAAL